MPPESGGWEEKGDGDGLYPCKFYWLLFPLLVKPNLLACGDSWLVSDKNGRFENEVFY